MGFPLEPLIIGLLGGLAIFLYGMEQMTSAFKSVAGEGLSKVLAKLARNRFTAAGTGAFVTAVIQSSSITTVLVVGFISAGLMTLQQSIGVIMGANIGTTFTTQIIAFNITEYALAIVAVGVALSLFAKHRSWRHYGTMIMGLGMIFLGMKFMGEATSPLRTHQPFIDFMRDMSNPLLGIAVAAVFTAVVQSSSATTGIVIVLASQGFITLEAGIAMTFGANIGTCVTAALATINQPRQATQAAAAHLLFNVAGVLIWLPFIDWLADAVRSISPAYASLSGTARLAAETPRQIANAHTMFNVANTFFFIWFTGPIALLVTKLLPNHPPKPPENATPQFLQDVLIKTAAIAIDRTHMEVVRLGKLTSKLSRDAIDPVVTGTSGQLDEIVRHDREITQLYDAINDYIRRLTVLDLNVKESHRLEMLTVVASHIDHMGETVALNLVAIARERLSRNVRFGSDTVKEIRDLADHVQDTFDMAIRALDEPELAQQVIAMKKDIQARAGKLIEHLGRRLSADDPHRAVLYRLESQVVEIFQREYYFAKKIAKQISSEAERRARTSSHDVENQ